MYIPTWSPQHGCQRVWWPSGCLCPERKQGQRHAAIALRNGGSKPINKRDTGSTFRRTQAADKIHQILPRTRRYRWAWRASLPTVSVGLDVCQARQVVLATTCRRTCVHSPRNLRVADEGTRETSEFMTRPPALRLGLSPSRSQSRVNDWPSLSFDGCQGLQHTEIAADRFLRQTYQVQCLVHGSMPAGGPAQVHF